MKNQTYKLIIRAAVAAEQYIGLDYSETATILHLDSHDWLLWRDGLNCPTDLSELSYERMQVFVNIGTLLASPLFKDTREIFAWLTAKCDELDNVPFMLMEQSLPQMQEVLTQLERMELSRRKSLHKPVNVKLR